MCGRVDVLPLLGVVASASDEDLVVAPANDVATLPEEGVEQLSVGAAMSWNSLSSSSSDGGVGVAANVEEDGEGEGVEVLLPVEAAEGTEVEADEARQRRVVADGAVDVPATGFANQSGK